MSRADVTPAARAAAVPLLSPSITVDRIRRIFTPPASVRLDDCGAMQPQQQQQQQEEPQEQQQDRDGAQTPSVTPVHSERFAEMRLRFECSAGSGGTAPSLPAQPSRRRSWRSHATASSPSPPASSPPPSSPLSLTTMAIKVGCQALATAGPEPAPRALPRRHPEPSAEGAERPAALGPRGVVSATGARPPPIAARRVAARSRLNSGPISKRLSSFMRDDSSSSGAEGDDGGRADGRRDPAAAGGQRDNAATGPPGAGGPGAEESRVLRISSSSGSTALSSPTGSPGSQPGSVAESDAGAGNAAGSPVFAEPARHRRRHRRRHRDHRHRDHRGQTEEEERAVGGEDGAAPGATAEHGKPDGPVAVETGGSRHREVGDATTDDDPARPRATTAAHGSTSAKAGDLRHKTPLPAATGTARGKAPVTLTTTPVETVSLAVTPAMTPSMTKTASIATSASNTNLTPSVTPAKTASLTTIPAMPTSVVTMTPNTTPTTDPAVTSSTVLTVTPGGVIPGGVTPGTTVTPAGPVQTSPVSRAASTDHNDGHRGNDGCPRDATEETAVDGAGEEEEEEAEPRFGGPGGPRCLELPGLADEPGEDLLPGRKVHFSHEPIKVFATFSAERYVRRNDAVDPVRASAEMALEKRIDELDVQRIALQKGIEGLGITIVGLGAAAGPGERAGPRPGAKQLGGIYVRGLAPGGAAHAHGGICEMDQILAVDNTSLVGASQEVAARVLQSTGEMVRLVIGREKGAPVVGSGGNTELSIKYKELLIRFAAVTNEVEALKKEVREAEVAQSKGERQRHLLQTMLKEERRRVEALQAAAAGDAERAAAQHRELLQRHRRALALLAPTIVREHGLADGGDGEHDGENGGDGKDFGDAQQPQEQQRLEALMEENGNGTASHTGDRGPPLAEGPRPPGPRPGPYISKGPLWRRGGSSAARPLSSVIGFDLPWARRRDPRGGRLPADATPDPPEQVQATRIRDMIPSILRHLSPKQRRKHGAGGDGEPSRLLAESPEEPRRRAVRAAQVEAPLTAIDADNT